MLPGRDAAQSVRPAQGNELGVWFFLALAFGISWGTFVTVARQRGPSRLMSSFV